MLGDRESSNKRTLVNDVRRMSLDAYKGARERFVESAISNLPIVAVYEYGRVSVPGVSDLDFLLVLDEAKCGEAEIEGNLWTDGYLVDRPILVSKGQFRNLEYLLYAGSLKVIWGTECVKSKLPEEEDKNILLAARLADSAQLLLHNLAKIAARDQVSARTCLLRVKSALHSVALAEQLGISLEDCIYKFVGEVKEVRERWLDQPNFDRLNCLVEYAPKVVITILDRLERLAIDRKWWVKCAPPDGVGIAQVSENSFTIFNNGNAGEQDVPRVEVLRGPRLRRGIRKVDFSISSTKVGGFLGDHIVQCASYWPWVRVDENTREKYKCGKLNNRYKEVIRRRMKEGKSHIRFLTRNGLVETGQLPPYGGFFYRKFSRKGLYPQLKRIGARGYAGLARCLFSMRSSIGASRVVAYA